MGVRFSDDFPRIGAEEGSIYTFSEPLKTHSELGFARFLACTASEGYLLVGNHF